METLTTTPQWRGFGQPAISLEKLYGVRWLWRLLRRLRMALALFGPLALFLHGDPLLRWFDPTAAVVDAGALSLVLLAVVALGTFLAVSRWLVGLLWPVMRGYQRNHFANNFKSLLPWQKITFYLVIFFGLLYAFVCCLASVF